MMKFRLLILLLFVAVFILPTSVSAAANPGVKPGSFFYFFDTALERVNLFFTFNPEKKARKALEYADERLAEAEAVAKEKNTDAVKTAVAGYEGSIALAAEESKQIKDKGKAEGLLTSIADNTSKHQEILSDVLSKVPDEIKKAITKAIEASKRGQEEATKQIVELKGKVEQLKREAAELKQQGDSQVNQSGQSAEIEKLKKEVKELKNKPTLEKLRKDVNELKSEPAPTNTTKPSVPPISTGNQEIQKQVLPPLVAPPNTILCNSKYWTNCPIGQKFYCPATGDAQCLYENSGPNSVTENPQIKIEKCKIEAQTNINNFLEAGKAAINEAFTVCVQNRYNELEQQLGGAIPGTLGDMVKVARLACTGSAQDGLNKLEDKADEIYSQQYFECLNR